MGNLWGKGRAEADQLEQSPRAINVPVLVERPLACGTAQLLGTARVVEELRVGVDRLVRGRDDEQLPAGLEPAVDSLVRIGDDRRSGHRQLERACRRGGGNGRVCAAGD